MNSTARLLFIASAALIVGACATPIEDSKTTAASETSTAAPPPPPPSSTQDSRSVARVDTTPKQPLDPLSDPNNPLSSRSVFFDFDSFAIKSEFQPTVEAHGRYLVANKNRRIVIEGNADERGSREYNLALGQKRAEAVKSRLALLGVPDSQIETVSLGEEKPRATGHDEDAWAQNRRADIVYK